jgi:hypothetical protein
MPDRLEILTFLEDAAAQMARIARGDGVPPHVAEELGKIALELGEEAAQLRAELRLDSLTAKVANNNRRGLTGLSD